MWVFLDDSFFYVYWYGEDRVVGFEFGFEVRGGRSLYVRAMCGGGYVDGCVEGIGVVDSYLLGVFVFGGFGGLGVEVVLVLTRDVTVRNFRDGFWGLSEIERAVER